VYSNFKEKNDTKLTIKEIFKYRIYQFFWENFSFIQNLSTHILIYLAASMKSQLI